MARNNTKVPNSMVTGSTGHHGPRVIRATGIRNTAWPGRLGPVARREPFAMWVTRGRFADGRAPDRNEAGSGFVERRVAV